MTKRTLKQEMKLTLRQPKLNKRCTLKEYMVQLLNETEYEEVPARCSEILIMNDKEYNYFKNNLLADYSFLEGLKCGTGSDYETDKEHVWQLTKEEMEQWKAQSYRLATMIFNKDTNEKFYINTEGYSYARYVLFD